MAVDVSVTTYMLNEIMRKQLALEEEQTGAEAYADSVHSEQHISEGVVPTETHRQTKNQLSLRGFLNGD